MAKPRGALVHTSSGLISLDPMRGAGRTTSRKRPGTTAIRWTRACSQCEHGSGPGQRPILQTGEEGYVETHTIFPGEKSRSTRPVLAGTSALVLGLILCRGKGAGAWIDQCCQVISPCAY